MMKRKLQFLSVVAMTAIMGTVSVSAQTALPGIIQAESGTFFGAVNIVDGNGGTGNAISGFYGAANYATYSVSVATAGIYNMEVVYLNTSGAGNTAGLKVSAPSIPFDVFGGYFLPVGGTFFEYATATKNGLYLPAGTYVLKIENASGYGINIDSFTITPGARSRYGAAINVTSANTASNIFEAENYDIGGEGISHKDTSLGNSFAAAANTVSYRVDNIDVGLQAGASNGNIVGNITANEWMEYTVNVANAGAYKFEITYASGNASTNVTNGKISAATYNTSGTLLTELIPTTTPVVVTGNSNWNDYRMIESNAFNLVAGANQIIRISMAGGAINLDTFKLIYTGPSLGVNSFNANSKALNVYPNPSTDGIFNLGESSIWEAYSILGAKVAQGEGTVVNLSGATKGIYVIKTAKGSTKVVVQ